MDYTTTALLASIRRRTMAPTATAAGTADADLLALANEELQSYIAPLLLSVREEYLLANSSTTMTAGTAGYRLPSRAVGAKLREVVRLDSSSRIFHLALISLDELDEWPTDNGTPLAFYFRGAELVLVPPPSAAETLRMTYYRRPAEMVATTAVGAITAINTTTKVVTCATVPTTFDTGDTFDFVKSSAPFEVLAGDLAATAVTTGASGTVTLTAALPSGLAVGDYVCLADQSPVPQVPAELHPLLAHRVVVKICEALGDQQGLTLAQAQLAQAEQRIVEMLAPRIDGEPKIVGSNQFGLLGRNMGSAREGW